MHPKKRLGWFWKSCNNTRSGSREKRLEALKATRAFLHYVYNCSVLKATSHVSCEATPLCYWAVWASSPSNINANHCSHSINIERKVQFTSDLVLMNLDGREIYWWVLLNWGKFSADSLQAHRIQILWTLYFFSTLQFCISSHIHALLIETIWGPSARSTGINQLCVWEFRLTGEMAADCKDKPLFLFGSFWGLPRGQQDQRSSCC